MDLIFNSLFRSISKQDVAPNCPAGIYRVILNDQLLPSLAVVLVEPDEKAAVQKKGGRKKKPDAALKRPRKKAPRALLGELRWIDRGRLQSLSDEKLLQPIELVRPAARTLEGRDKEDYERRVEAMAGFLDPKNLQESIVVHSGLAGLVKEAMERAGVSRSYVYKQWSSLCRFGIHERSLTPARDRCGAPGVARPSDRLPDGKLSRQKAGRWTLKQRVARAHGQILPPEQPGMSSEWAAAIRAADKLIPTPKPAWPARCDLIIRSSFCGKAQEEDGKIVVVAPEKGSYPNNRQIRRVIDVLKTRIERIIERTTKRHFKMAKRGLVARNWQGVAGPGHTWAIDSTVGDVYLRSSVNRAWIVGRPIVYIIVDIWSTAVVGFYVCLTGPSWNTAKVSLFNAAADPHLVAEMWGYQPILTLDPAPTMCYALMCDRGEYLSKAHRATALKLIPLTSYAPPYRGDLKGLVEVLHRIEKDKQFLFIPGAMDFRREELELRRVNPEDCVMTVREYTHYLYEIFTEYNATADRSHRRDDQMIAAGVYPSPAGLWRWGHAMGIGFRRHVDQGDLISELLPSSTGYVRDDAVRHAGCDYWSTEVQAAQWTTIARNLGGREIPVSHYPGAMQSIWTPNQDAGGHLRLKLRDESRVSAEVSFDEWMDCLALQVMQRPDAQHERLVNAMGSLDRIRAIKDNAVRLTSETLAKASGPVPTMAEARQIEVAGTSHPSKSEAKAGEQLRDEALEEHESMLAALLRSAQ